MVIRCAVLRRLPYLTSHTSHPYLVYKKLACNAFLAFRDFLRRTCTHDVTAFMSAVRTEVYDMVGTLYDIEVVLDD